MEKSWKFAAVSDAEKKSLAKALGISEIIAGILLRRGIHDRTEAARFLFMEEQSFHDPMLLQDMEAAVGRIQAAIEAGEKIIVYGDYDVDGITATALLLRALRALGADADFYIPDRQTEGYGLHAGALQTISKTSTLMISVDCGISAVEEVSQRPETLDIIITDHHLPGPVLPPALAVINPHRSDCLYPDKQLAGVGVAFKLCQALWLAIRGEAFAADLEIVALGTVADIVPLLGENRLIVKRGLEAMQTTGNTGLAALLKVCDLTEKKIGAGDIGFILGPRLNAAGRLLQANLGVELLLTEDESRAADLARQLDEENSERQRIEKEIFLKAEQQIEANGLGEDKVLVLAGENWHSGVIGIVASRIVEKYYRPVVVIGIKDGVGKGSCRSIKGFHMHEALTACSDLLLGFGGHAQAAGLSVLPEHINELRARLARVADQQLDTEDFIPVLEIESNLSLAEVDAALLRDLERLEPYGMGNPRPLFACRNVTVVSARSMGREGAHLRLSLAQGAEQVAALAWNKGELAAGLNRVRLDIAFQPDFNTWQGKTSIQFKLQDLREPTPLTRETVGRVYLLLKHHPNHSGRIATTPEQVLLAYQQRYRNGISLLCLQVTLRVLRELGLFSLKMEASQIEIQFAPEPKEKLDLMQSPTFVRETWIANEFSGYI